MRYRNVPARDTRFVCEGERSSGELETRTSARGSAHFHFVPADARCAVERFCERLFGGETASQRGGDITTHEIGALSLAANSRVKTIAVAFKRAPHAIDRADVDAHANDHDSRGYMNVGAEVALGCGAVMTKLSVNVNKVATLRNTRPQLDIPSVVRCSRICLEAGAYGITVHPRPDERHIKPNDLDAIVTLLKDFRAAELNIEGNPFETFMDLVEKAKPTQATLVPDTTDALTSDHGWDLKKDFERLKPIVDRLKNKGIRVSLFMDPDPTLMELAKKIGADCVALYTEPYAAAFAKGDANAAAPYATSAARAQALGLAVNAGHDLNLDNLAPFLKNVKGVAEVSIGHALIGDALEFGLYETVKKYLAACAS